MKLICYNFKLVSISLVDGENYLKQKGNLNIDCMLSSYDIEGGVDLPQ